MNTVTQETDTPRVEDMTDEQLVGSFTHVENTRKEAAKAVEELKLERQLYWNELRSRHALNTALPGSVYLTEGRMVTTGYKEVLFRLLRFVLRTQTRTRESLVKETARVIHEETKVSTWGTLSKSPMKNSTTATPDSLESKVLDLLSPDED